MSHSKSTVDDAFGSGQARGFDARRFVAQLADDARTAYVRNQRVMSFGEYLTLFASDPWRHTRSAAAYLRDAFDYYGSEMVTGPRGSVRRFKLFDCPWDEGRERLLGQEEVQDAVYRLLSNFAAEGATNRLILLHGPNGSAKSTLVGCMQRALEDYSTKEEGARYRFNWIFPVQKLVKGGIGFGEHAGMADSDSFAYLEDAQIEARFIDELRDPPLLLLPVEQRRMLFAQLLGPLDAAPVRPSRLLLHGALSPRNRMIFEALFTSYRGDLARVLAHVQVERYFISRRYRQGIATVGPQLAVDAAVRQLTVGRNLGGLPPAIQALPLHEYQGELVDGNHGLVEYEDLLKRPLDTFKYLLGTIEDGQVSLDLATLQIDTVFVASSNETYLSSFKEIPEFQSFKGRMELVRAPYLLDYRIETEIYADHIQRTIAGPGRRHVAPHVAWTAGLWAVLTRMKKPMSEKYPKPVAELVARLGPLDKALLYAGQEPREGFSAEQVRELRAYLEKIARESDGYPNYEGRSGASPREMKLVLMNAAQSTKWTCVSPFAVLEELEELVKSVSVYEFLKQEPLSGGYHEHRKFVFQVRDLLLDRIDEDVRVAMGLVDEGRYLEQFSRYVVHVSNWIKGEKVQNPITGQEEPPSEDLMAEIERILDVGTGARREEFRREVIARIGAWSVDHPHARPVFEQIFPRQIERLKEAFYSENKKKIARRNQDLLTYTTEGGARMAASDAALAMSTLKTLCERFGYCERCARDAVWMLMRRRYTD